MSIVVIYCLHNRKPDLIRTVVLKLSDKTYKMKKNYFLFNLFSLFLLIVVILHEVDGFKPVIIAPGTGGSRLEAKLNKPSVNHWYCSATSDWYTLWLSVASLLPPAINCWVDNIMLLWDPNTKQYSNNLGK